MENKRQKTDEKKLRNSIPQRSIRSYNRKHKNSIFRNLQNIMSYRTKLTESIIGEIKKELTVKISDLKMFTLISNSSLLTSLCLIIGDGWGCEWFFSVRKKCF